MHQGWSSKIRIFNPVRIKPRKLLLSTVCALIAAAAVAGDDAVLKAKLGPYKYFEPNLVLPLPARVQTMPDEFLQWIIDFDRSIGIANTDYRPRVARPADIAQVAEYLELLPKRFRTVLSKKLLAVHFVDNFSGAGLTDWSVDQRGEMYYYMILNSALLTESLDDWLTYRENSYFTQAPGSYRLAVRTGTQYKALLYGLLHEGGHIVDYEDNINPYLDPVHKKKINAGDTSDFTGGIWQSHKTPVDAYDFKNRDSLNVYGIFSDKPLIPADELPGMFTQLVRTPFVSFYGGTAWHEDFADLITYYHVERQLGGEVVVELIREDKVVDRLLPVKRGLDGDRLKILKDLY